MALLNSTTANTSISNKEITDFVANAGTDYNSIVSAANTNNISAQQLSDAMASIGDNTWSTSAINSYTPTPAAPAPTPTAQPNYDSLWGAGSTTVGTPQIQQWLSSNPGATDQQILDKAISSGISIKQLTDAAPSFDELNVNAYLKSRGISKPSTGNAGTPNYDSLWGEGSGATKADIQKWFTDNPNATDQQILDAAISAGINIDQLVEANPNFTKPNVNEYLKSRGISRSDSFKKPINPIEGKHIVLSDIDNPDFTPKMIFDLLSPFGGDLEGMLNAAFENGLSKRQIEAAFRIAGDNTFTVKAIDDFIEGRPGFNERTAADAQRDSDRAEEDERQERFSTLFNVPESKPINPDSFNPNYAEAAQATQDQTLGTVSGQLDRVLDKDSALMQQARTFGNQQSNDRGLLNSSIGIGSAQNEMIRAGLPIATADANSYNQFDLANAQNRQQANLFNSDVERQYDLAKLGISKDMAINAENIARDYGLAQMDTESKIKIADINAASKSSSDAAGLNDRLLISINEINGRDISRDAKTAQIQTMIDATDGAIAMLGAFDLMGNSLDFNNNPDGVLGANGRPAISLGGGDDSNEGSSSSISDTSTRITTSSGYTLSGNDLKKARSASERSGVGVHRFLTTQESWDISGLPQSPVGQNVSTLQYPPLFTKARMDELGIIPIYEGFGSIPRVEFWAYKA